MLQARTRTLIALLLFVAVLAPAVATAAAPSWSGQASAAVRDYQKQLSGALEPLFGDWKQLTSKAAQASANPLGSLVPASPVETLDAYKSLYTLAAFPDKWRIALMAAAAKARDQGAKAKNDGKPPEAPHSRFQADFAGKPRALAYPRIPGAKGDAKGELPLEATLAALDAASSSDQKAVRAYQKQADRFAEILGAKVGSRVRDRVLKLRGKLAKLLPENPPEWKELPDDLGQPIAYFLASAYYEGHGGLIGTTSTTGTGDGAAAAAPTEGGTGAGASKEPGTGGTGSGDAAGEPSADGTGAGKVTPKEFKDRPGTGSGKSDPKAAPKGTGK
ncbi:MAG: hypothetical protein HY303_18510 [Candidatus Wallbacteria bacterium]|nr:hypothetical protein [Candidatus Wallbacteria bacterium]